MTTLTTADIEAGFDNENWLGWGYLGERSRATTRWEVGNADQIVLRFAHALGWTADDLFAWANSKDGRYLGDWAFGGFDLANEPAWLPSLFPAHPAAR